MIAAVRHVVDRLGAGLYGVACSGGADSIALAHAAIRVLGAPHVVVLTIDHQLTPGSGAVADGVAAWARGQGAAAVVRAVSVENRASLEAAAREARYAALAALQVELGLIAVLTGHTARDQAETVLMRILRGTGVGGLTGVQAERVVHARGAPVTSRIVRPLLAVPRTEVERYVAAEGLPVQSDPMNEDPAFARVRIRDAVMPALRTENPQLDAALLRLADSAAEWREVIDARALPLVRMPIECGRVAAEPVAIRKRVIARVLELAGLGYDGVHLDALDAVLCSPERGEVTIDVPGGRMVRRYGRMYPVAAGAAAAGSAPALEAPEGHVLRVWQPGDRMRPARLRGRSRKLSDLYIDARIARARRATARVLVRSADGVIVWAEHLGLAFGETLAPGQTGGSF